MCDPISIGLTLAGSALQSISQGQVAGAQKRDIAASGKSYDAEREKQAGYTAKNTATVGDTLANYSPDAANARIADASGKREAAYLSPFDTMSFGAAPVANAAPNSAVEGRNATTASAARDYALGTAKAKAALDGYGDARTIGSLHGADNATSIAINNRNASGSQAAEGVQQATLGSKMEADKSAGRFTGGLGDLFTAAGSLYGMAGGSGLMQSVNEFGARNGIGALSNGLKYTSPFAGLPNSAVYSRALAPL